MRFTIFHTYVIKHILRLFSWLLLKVFRWRIEGVEPEKSKFIMVCAPHTSNWDLLLIVCYAMLKNIKVRWIGKKSIFVFPFAPLMKWLGGIPVDREKSTHFVHHMAQEFARHKEMVLAIAPAGTRKAVSKWKSGFYWMAMEAKVPLGLAFADYKRRRVGLLQWFQPTGDYLRDLKDITAIYAKNGLTIHTGVA